jgi:hypothetical protein
MPCKISRVEKGEQEDEGFGNMHVVVEVEICMTRREKQTLLARGNQQVRKKKRMGVALYTRVLSRACPFVYAMS